MMLEEYGKRAKAAARALACATTEEKNGALLKIAAAIEENAPAILTANADDLTNGRASGLSDALLDRLALNEARIAGIADRVGSLTAGKDADIVITHGDPLDMLCQVRKVWIDGRLVKG